jgi:genome maintenance exonuclease 1
MYKHLDIQISDIARQISQHGGQRLYQTPTGEIYPSITTVLAPLKKEIIQQWRYRVGDEVADAESQWGRDRGNALHLACEELLKNKPISGHPLLIQILVEDLKPYLRRINNIHCQEQVLYSDLFKIGGRCDCIAEYNNILSVVDLKGSKRPKRNEWITDYFIQTSFYAYAYFERTKRKINQCVILMASDQGQAQEFIVKPWDYWSDLKQIRKQYKENFHI